MPSTSSRAGTVSVRSKPLDYSRLTQFRFFSFSLFTVLYLIGMFPRVALLHVVSQLLFRRSESHPHLVRADISVELSHIPYLQFVGTFVLLMVVFSVSDRCNSGLHPSLIPLAIFFVILGVGAAFGMQTGMSHHHDPGLSHQ